MQQFLRKGTPVIVNNSCFDTSWIGKRGMLTRDEFEQCGAGVLVQVAFPDRVRILFRDSVTPTEGE